MDPISNADRLVRLLRQQLEKREQAKKTSKSSTEPFVHRSGLEQVRTVAVGAAKAGVGDNQLRRFLIEQLLGDQFGDEAINEPRFQQIVDQVYQIMSNDAEVSQLLHQVMTDLRN